MALLYPLCKRPYSDNTWLETHSRSTRKPTKKKTNMAEGKRACALDCWPNSFPSVTIDFRSTIHFLVRSTSLEVRLICVMYDPFPWCTIHFPNVRFIFLEVRSISYKDDSFPSKYDPFTQSYDSFPSRYDPLTLRYDRFPLRYDPFPNFVPNPPP